MLPRGIAGFRDEEGEIARSRHRFQVAAVGLAALQHRKTSIRIEGGPESAVLRSVLDRIFR
ncbi:MULTISPECIES: hypothetical protein [Burkholderia]|uniref:hypothetical protein n=1 Tax=Burkholderia TaxID=32008 RepID=UPI00126A4541|nr:MULTISPECIES: hypothetical protein [Burkholderia]